MKTSNPGQKLPACLFHYRRSMATETFPIRCPLSNPYKLYGLESGGLYYWRINNSPVISFSSFKIRSSGLPWIRFITFPHQHSTKWTRSSKSFGSLHQFPQSHMKKKFGMTVSPLPSFDGSCDTVPGVGLEPTHSYE